MYRVHYLSQPWSEGYETPPYPNYEMHHPTGEVTVDCGITPSVELFIQGVYPGTYFFTPYDTDGAHPTWPQTEETFVVVVAHPDLPNAARLIGDLL